MKRVLAIRKVTSFRFHILTVCLLMTGVAGTETVYAQDYFDPSFLSDGGPQADLTAYETVGTIPEGTYLVDVYMNQQKEFTRQVRFVKDTEGDVIPELTPDMLQSMGVAVRRLDKIKALLADKPLGDLKHIIPAASVKFDLPALKLDITVPQIDMDVTAEGSVNPALWDEGITAFLLSYNLSGSRNRMTTSAWSSGSISQNLFGSANGGVNLGAWRLRSSVTYSRNETDGDSYRYKNTQIHRGDTYLQRDIQRLRSEMTIGENSSGGDIFDSIPFRGLQLVSSDEMLPTSQRSFAPVITGTATSNAKVTVSQNGNVIYETNVPPGPFRLTDIYNAGDGGELLVTVTEADGSKHVSTQTFSSLPVMKRPGGTDFEVTVGRYRNSGYTTDSRDPVFAMTTTTLGLPHNITVYGGLLGSRNYQSLAVGIGVSLGWMGAISLDSTFARATLTADKDQKEKGASFRARYSKSLMSTGTTVDLTAYRYSTNHYYSFQDAMSQGYDLRHGFAPWLAERRRSSWQMNISQTMGGLGAVFIRARRDDFWGNGRVVNSMGAGFSSSIKGMGYSVNYDIDHTSGNKGDYQWATNRQISLNISLPFSIFSPTRETVRDINANYSMTHDNNGRMSQQVGLSGSLLDNRISWNASRSANNQGGGETGDLGLGYSGSSGNITLGYGSAPHTQTWSVNASGGMLVHQHGVNFTGVLGDSMALVEAPGAGGVSVLSGNAMTDSRGYAVVPYLQNYQPNTLSLDPTTLPDGVDLGDDSSTVYPTKGALVEVKFKTRVGRQAMLTLLSQGNPVPFGAIAALPSDDIQNAAIVGDAGQVYLTGAPQHGNLFVSWGSTPDRQCRVSYDLGPQTSGGKNQNHPALNIVQKTLNCMPLADNTVQSNRFKVE